MWDPSNTTTGDTQVGMYEERSGRTTVRRRVPERGAALKYLAAINHRHPNDPLRQARVLLRAVGIQALTGRARQVSSETRIAYERRMGATLKDLHSLNIRLRNLSELSAKHVARVVAYWEEQQLSASSLQNRYTVLARMLMWLDKDHELLPLRRLLKNPASSRRSLIRLEGHGFSSRGRDVEDFIERAYERNATFGIQCDLMNQFGLRPEEVVMFRPIEADEGNRIRVHLGTKGGKPRVVAIRTCKQREVLDRAKTFVLANPHKKGTFQEAAGMTLEQAQRRLRLHAEALGLTKKASGLTLYSFRHEFAVRTYEELAGEKAPILGGKPSRLKDAEVRGTLTAYLGHHRKSVTGAYCSTVPSMDRAVRQRLEKLQAGFKDPEVVSHLRAAGVTSVVLTGAAARGEAIQDQVIVAVAGEEGSEDRCLLTLEAVLHAQVSFISMERAASGDTFEVF